MARSGIRYRDIIAIGASAGGGPTLSELVSGLPAELPATILVVQHVAPAAKAMLPAILSRAGELPATLAVNDEPIERGHNYVAPPDHHLLVGEGRLLVTRGPRENRHRPAVDLLFRSAARHYGRRVMAVVLSGMLDDGTAGLVTVKARGGVAIVQDPDDAIYSAMPKNAIEGDHPDYVVRVSELADLLGTLVQERLEPAAVNGWQRNRLANEQARQ
jgi:two-component system chemotaxis response regulator CheB